MDCVVKNVYIFSGLQPIHIPCELVDHNVISCKGLIINLCTILPSGVDLSKIDDWSILIDRVGFKYTVEVKLGSDTYTGSGRLTGSDFSSLTVYSENLDV